jgi:hypothetical protein
VAKPDNRMQEVSIGVRTGTCMASRGAATQGLLGENACTRAAVGRNELLWNAVFRLAERAPGSLHAESALSLPNSR